MTASRSPAIPRLPPRLADVDELEEFMSVPSADLIEDLRRLDGDLMILGVGGKMGPTLARLAKRAAPDKRVIGVARFSEAGVRERLESWGIDWQQCDLLDRAALEQLPRVKNIIFMAGRKFGSTENRCQTWAINVGLPMLVAETFRDSRLIVFSTACVYPYSDVHGTGSNEATPTVPPPGDYANSCVGREQMFLYGSSRFGTPGRLVRLSYAIDLRYGVLHDVARCVFAEEPLDVSMARVNVIWQGDANESALRLLAHCTTPTSPINITGPEKVSVRNLAEQFGQLLGKRPRLTGHEASTAWLVDTTAAYQLFGLPRVPLATMIEWVADWVASGQPSLDRRTHFETRDGKY